MRRVKTYMVERGRLCRCAHCASVRGAMQMALVPMARNSDRRDYELMLTYSRIPRPWSDRRPAIHVHLSARQYLIDNNDRFERLLEP